MKHEETQTIGPDITTTVEPLQLVLGPVQERPRLEGTPPQPPEFTIWELGDPSQAVPAVYVDARCLVATWEHAVAHLHHEVGGLLLGETLIYLGEPVVRIDHSLIAQHAAERRDSLTFTQQTWAELNKAQAEQFPNSTVVGWYHTHPGYRVFLSAHDQFVHRHFFSTQNGVALVIDPRNVDAGFFSDQGGMAGRLKGYRVFASQRLEEIEIAKAAAVINQLATGSR
ncbi:MAG: Mov34/MPN/PAD-1 family protein [Planctomycetes bacterium]|nr:Mov34/MPN/PAD-1 family protein [Planctomycetota bacterium]